MDPQKIKQQIDNEAEEKKRKIDQATAEAARVRKDAEDRAKAIEEAALK